MINYTAFTLVDVTHSNEIRSKKNNTFQYHQQQNYNTLVQTIGLRSQPINMVTTRLLTQDVAEYGFGKRYKGLHTVWRIDFSIEHTDVFKFKGNDMYHLMNDCDGVAIITKLEETTEIKTKCFETINKNYVNILFNKTTLSL
tara:strand:- start:78 stop:503 length:426 start_codon:yes stop_codon:yes gene_type:complete